MPYHIDDNAAGCDGFAVVKDDDGEVMGCHTSEDAAKKQMAALYANENASRSRPPRESLVRAMPGQFEIRAADDDGSIGYLSGYFATVNEWAEIDSAYEGHFMERNAPGFAEQTIRENRKSMKILFNHGHDPSIGDKVLGPLRELEENSQGVFYGVPLFDTSYNRDLLPGLKAGEYGASYRFTVLADEWVKEPEASDHNPNGLPERTITRARIFEGGPVTFPAYAGASAAARSMTDEFLFEGLVEDPANRSKLATFARTIQGTETAPTPSGNTEPPPQTETPKESGREATVPEETQTPAPAPAPVDALVQYAEKYPTRGDLEHRRREIAERAQKIDDDTKGKPQTAETKNEWEALKAEKRLNEALDREFAERERDLAEMAGNATERAVAPVGTERAYAPETFAAPRRVADPFDIAAARASSSTDAEYERTVRDNALQVIDRARFDQDLIPREDAQAHAEKLVRKSGRGWSKAFMARWVLTTGSERYERAFSKYLAGLMRTEEENRALEAAQLMEHERALSLAGASGGFAIPFELDPTILGTSNGAVNPWRALSRVVQISVDEWRGVSAGGVTITYGAEATEAADNAPTLAQPTVSTEKAQAFIPFSIEVGMDWDTLRTEMARLLQEGKDETEAVKFATGTGTNEPFGVVTGTTNTVNAAAGQTFTIANLYALQEALPPRYEPNAAFAMNTSILNRIRQFDTAGGANLLVTLSQSTRNRENGRIPQDVLGYPTWTGSALASTPATGNKFALFGDFSRFLIVDRVGLTIELIDHIVGTNHRPTGQRGLYAYFRNGSKLLDANAMRALIGVV